MSIFIIIVIVRADAQFYDNHNHIAQLYDCSGNLYIRNVCDSHNLHRSYFIIY